MEEKVFVYFDNDKDIKILIGYLFFEYINGKEKYSFQYSSEFLKSKYRNMFIDSSLYLDTTRQFAPKDMKIFGFLSDLAPDRWGRTLIKRKETIVANIENRHVKTLNEIDYLLAVSDESRMGAIRLSKDGTNYLSNDTEMEVPPMENIRKLEAAIREYEKDDNIYNDKWLKQLLGPGSSLGGARPKAAVKDLNGDLWIAKFQSRYDEYDIGAWEKTAQDLAKLCGLNVCETKLIKYSSNGSIFLIKRFDRENKERIHFISSMTALGLKDGDGAQNNMGYLDILSFIKMNCKDVKKQELELFKRVVFNMCIGNIDDHFRNHGFVFKSGCLELSPIYDINPNVESDYLSLNISEDSAKISDETILSSSIYYDLTLDEVEKILNDTKKIVRENYKSIALKNKISENSIKYMQDAFKFSLT
jgi:serine/threonine-protein kinase HipA